MGKRADEIFKNLGDISSEFQQLCIRYNDYREQIKHSLSKLETASGNLGDYCRTNSEQVKSWMQQFGNDYTSWGGQDPQFKQIIDAIDSAIAKKQEAEDQLDKVLPTIGTLQVRFNTWNKKLDELIQEKNKTINPFAKKSLSKLKKFKPTAEGLAEMFQKILKDGDEIGKAN